MSVTYSDEAAKAIKLSTQARVTLGVEAEELTPVELLHAILLAPVDLLYNGGIGTDVKASFETHLQVGDKAGDAFRVNGAELRCKVLAEGGNLGATQRGRIEYAQHTMWINALCSLRPGTIVGP